MKILDIGSNKDARRFLTGAIPGIKIVETHSDIGNNELAIEALSRLLVEFGQKMEVLENKQKPRQDDLNKIISYHFLIAEGLVLYNEMTEEVNNMEYGSGASLNEKGQVVLGDVETDHEIDKETAKEIDEMIEKSVQKQKADKVTYKFSKEIPDIFNPTYDITDFFKSFPFFTGINNTKNASDWSKDFIKLDDKLMNELFPKPKEEEDTEDKDDWEDWKDEDEDEDPDDDNEGEDWKKDIDEED